MDTQEYADFAGTKNINKDMEYGCAKCNDLSIDLMNPKKYSFLNPRGVEQIVAISNCYEDTGNDEENICAKFDDWKDNGHGYTAIHGADVLYDDEHCPDPSYTITTDMAHAAKNILQQLFATTMATEAKIKERAQMLFGDMISICKFNKIPKTISLTIKNWAGSPGWLKDITLEIAPIGLVTFCAFSIC